MQKNHDICVYYLIGADIINETIVIYSVKTIIKRNPKMGIYGNIVLYRKRKVLCVCKLMTFAYYSLT